MKSTKLNKNNINDTQLKEHKNFQVQSESNILSILINSTDDNKGIDNKEGHVLANGKERVEVSKMTDKQLERRSNDHIFGRT